MMISFEQLRTYSGLSRPADVRRWLCRHGIPHHVQPGGKPVTTQAAIDKSLLTGVSSAAEPNWSALNEASAGMQDQGS